MQIKLAIFLRSMRWATYMNQSDAPAQSLMNLAHRCVRIFPAVNSRAYEIWNLLLRILQILRFLIKYGRFPIPAF
jgi:hypothetical protein